MRIVATVILTLTRGCVRIVATVILTLAVHTIAANTDQISRVFLEVLPLSVPNNSVGLPPKVSRAFLE